MSLRDDLGAAVTGATWTSTNASLVSLSADDPPVLTAQAAGEATITATKSGLSRTATITVVVGTTLADGTIGLADGTPRWTVAPTLTPNSSWYEAPIYTHRIDAVRVLEEDGPARRREGRRSGAWFGFRPRHRPAA